MSTAPRNGRKASPKKYPYFGIRPSGPLEKRVRDVAAGLTKKRNAAGLYGEVTVSEVILTCISRGLPAMEKELGSAGR